MLGGFYVYCFKQTKNIFICMLFVIAGNINTGKNAITTSATTRQLPIYNVITDEKKVALTMNCAW